MSLIMFLNTVGESLEQGDVVVIGHNPTLRYYGASNDFPIPEVDLAATVYDARVLGIVSAAYAELQEEKDKKTASKEKTSAKGRSTKVVGPRQAFTAEELERLDRTTVGPNQMGWLVTHGVFPACKVDADPAPIKIGDLLTTSPTKGHAQRVLEPGKAIGAIIGKALGSLNKGKGKIPVLVMLQ